MLACLCTMAGSLACLSCPSYRRQYPPPMWSYKVEAPKEIDYDRLAEEVAKRLKKGE